MEPITAAVVYVDSDTGRTYTVRMVPENRLTDGDGRILVAPLTWRDGRLPFTFSDSEGEPHEDARHVGNLFNLRKEEFDGSTWVIADLDWDTDELALEAKRLVDEDRITKVSIHPTGATGYWICGVPSVISRESILEAAENFNPEECTDQNEWVQAYLDVEIGAATLLMLPAYEDAEVLVAANQEAIDKVLTTNGPVALFPSVWANNIFDSETDSAGIRWETVTASIDLLRPPPDWFTDPQLTGPTPLTITDDGHVFGHLANWDVCHRGFPGQCVTPPKDRTDYQLFHENARVMTSEGKQLAVGCLTFDVSHAPQRASLNDAKRHYDHSGTVGAFVRAGEDNFGIWVAGAIRPGLDESQIEMLRRLTLSGDWRPLDGLYHLIAAQAVPVPGFPIRSLVADGRQVEFTTVGPANEPPEPLEFVSTEALVASAIGRFSERFESLEAEIHALREQLVEERQQREYEKAMAVLTPMAVG